MNVIQNARFIVGRTVNRNEKDRSPCRVNGCQMIEMIGCKTTNIPYVHRYYTKLIGQTQGMKLDKQTPCIGQLCQVQAEAGSVSAWQSMK